VTETTYSPIPSHGWPIIHWGFGFRT